MIKALNKAQSVKLKKIIKAVVPRKNKEYPECNHALIHQGNVYLENGYERFRYDPKDKYFKYPISIGYFMQDRLVIKNIAAYSNDQLIISIDDLIRLVYPQGFVQYDEVDGFPGWIRDKRGVSLFIGKLSDADVHNIEVGHGFTSGDALRPALQAMIITTEGEFCATDAHTMFYGTTDLKPERSVFISTAAQKIIPLIHKTDIPVEISQSVVRSASMKTFEPRRLTNDAYDKLDGFTEYYTPDFHLISRRPGVKYPDYKSVIPVDNANGFKGNRREWIAELKNAVAQANTVTKMVVLDIQDGVVTLTGSDEYMETEYINKINVKQFGDNIKIGFCGTFLIKILQELNTEYFHLALSTPNRAGLIDYTFLAMPLMLK